QAVCELQISGDSLKRFVNTRWTSAYEYTLSVVQFQCAFIKELVASATFLDNDDNEEDILIILNIIHLNNETFQVDESNIDSEEELYNYEEIDENESVISNNEGQDVFDFDSADLAAEL
ncbi:15341_t:CDS:2, partial [Racocetra persica]